jgi:hypothetical protein
MEQPGGYWKSYHERFHDPCKVRAMVVDDGNKRTAIVGIDMLTIPRQMVESVRGSGKCKAGVALIACCPGHCEKLAPFLKHVEIPIGIIK